MHQVLAGAILPLLHYIVSTLRQGTYIHFFDDDFGHWRAHLIGRRESIDLLCIPRRHTPLSYAGWKCLHHADEHAATAIDDALLSM